MTKISSRWSLVIVICILSTPLVKAGQIEIVTNNDNDGPGSLRQALIDVLPDGQIMFDTQVLGTTIELTTGALFIDKSLSIINEDILQRININANGDSRVFIQSCNTRVLIRGINIVRGSISPNQSDALSLGGGIYSEGTTILENCDINGCQAAFGGGIWADTLIFSNCNIIDNTSYKDGGGIAGNIINGMNSTIASNRANGRLEKSRAGNVFVQGSAGGIMSNYALSITQCTISKNIAGDRGGGIYIKSLKVNQDLNITNCTITENVGERGGGIYGSSILIGAFSNNIIAGNMDSSSNKSDLNLIATWDDESLVQNNLIGVYDNLQIFPGNDHLIGNIDSPIDPLLSDLADHGGPTLTHIPLECSPAIDKGSKETDLMEDQRGFPRLAGDVIDIGSVEYEDPANQMCDDIACDNLEVDASIDKSVLFGFRSNRFRPFSCVDLEAAVSGGTPPYAYSWSPSIDINDPSVLQPSVCPQEDVVYTLTVKDANGCISSDEVSISAVSIRDVINLPRCGGRRNLVVICNPATDTRVCANIFSNSPTRGLGPLLNAGHITGPCTGIISDPKDTKSYASEKYIEKIWPIPSNGTINFTIRKAPFSKMSFQLYNEREQLLKEEIMSSSSHERSYHVVHTDGLSMGYHKYLITINGIIADRGSFYVKK